MKTTSGVYLISNDTSKSKYVGSSVNIHKRWNGHKQELRKSKHGNAHLQKAYNKYDLNGEFIKSFNSLMEAKTFLGMKNNHICSVLNGRRHSYKGFQFRKFYLEKIAPLKAHKKSVVIYQSGKYICDFNSISDAARSMGVNFSSLSQYLRDVGRNPLIKGYTAEYKNTSNNKEPN